MAWFSVTSTILANTGNLSFAFKCDDVDSIDELWDALAEDGCVVGYRYRVDNKRGDADRAFVDGHKIILTRSGIAQVQEFSGADRYAVFDRGGPY